MRGSFFTRDMLVSLCYRYSCSKGLHFRRRWEVDRGDTGNSRMFFMIYSVCLRSSFHRNTSYVGVFSWSRFSSAMFSALMRFYSRSLDSRLRLPFPRCRLLQVKSDTSLPRATITNNGSDFFKENSVLSFDFSASVFQYLLFLLLHERVVVGKRQR